MNVPTAMPPDIPRQRRHGGKPRFPESAEEKAARLVDLIRRSAPTPDATERLSGGDTGLPSVEVLRQRIAVRFNEADVGKALPKQAKYVMARELAESGHAVAAPRRRKSRVSPALSHDIVVSGSECDRSRKVRDLRLARTDHRGLSWAQVRCASGDMAMTLSQSLSLFCIGGAACLMVVPVSARRRPDSRTRKDTGAPGLIARG